MRWYRNGDPLDHGAFIRGDNEARFWSKVDASGDCWEWTGYTDQDGYGRVGVGRRVDQRTIPAHRYAWELMVGPIPEGLEIDHLCFNRPCVNPDHLEPVTHTENMRRRHLAMMA
jgi:hypothetical protein